MMQAAQDKLVAIKRKITQLGQMIDALEGAPCGLMPGILMYP